MERRKSAFRTATFDPLRFSVPQTKPRPVSEDERRNLIARAAYFRAARRGFEPGHETEDWLAAEKEIDQSLG